MDKNNDATYYVYEDAINAPKGEFSSYPLDESIILAYDIKKDEMIPYMNSKYFKVHWSEVLDEILQTRKQSK